MIIRAATVADSSALAAIYRHHVLHGFGTFEEAAPTPEDMAARLKAVTDLGLPYLIAEIDGAIEGFAYAGPFRTRAAYRYTVEDSVYIAPGRQGQGLGGEPGRALAHVNSRETTPYSRYTGNG